MEVQGRLTRVEVIELPRGARPLLGAAGLELMDWHIAPGQLPFPPGPLAEVRVEPQPIRLRRGSAKSARPVPL